MVDRLGQAWFGHAHQTWIDALLILELTRAKHRLPANKTRSTDLCDITNRSEQLVPTAGRSDASR